ncbi:NUDIX domain-containing protein [Streptomyces celluloflavus]|uniref:NUDIX domain-containing protein n=1 Tax=Streptomyces celluloflavus TaxID=58344 RepID=UPI0036DF1007
MPSVNLRHSVRAIILDENDRMLLCRFAIPDCAGTMVWAAPGGGIEQNETPLAALRRELWEEVGLPVRTDPPHVWHQEVVAPGHASRTTMRTVPSRNSGVYVRCLDPMNPNFPAITDSTLRGEGQTAFCAVGSHDVDHRMRSPSSGASEEWLSRNSGNASPSTACRASSRSTSLTH